MDVHLRDLRYFVAVGEDLHFTRAAERLFVSQPALSKQIRQLEQTLRVQLFERDRRSIRLTTAGAALLPLARELLGRWDVAEQQVADAAAAAAAELVVGFSTSLGRDLLPTVRACFGERRPSWRLRLRQVPWTDPTAGVGDRSSDVAIVWLPSGPDDVVSARVLLVEPRVVALPAGHRLAGVEEIAFADLLDEPFVALPPDAGALRDYWLATSERQGRPIRVGAEASSADDALEAVAAGQGLALMSAGNAAIYERPDIITRPVTGIAGSALAVVWRSDDHRSVVRDFVGCCVAATEREPPEPTSRPNDWIGGS